MPIRGSHFAELVLTTNASKWVPGGIVMQLCGYRLSVVIYAFALTLLAPGGLTSVVIGVFALLLPVWVWHSYPELDRIVSLSYPLSVPVVLLASALVVMMARDRRKALRRIAIVNSASIGGSLVVLAAEMVFMGWRPW